MLLSCSPLHLCFLLLSLALPSSQQVSAGHQLPLAPLLAVSAVLVCGKARPSLSAGWGGVPTADFPAPTRGPGWSCSGVTAARPWLLLGCHPHVGSHHCCVVFLRGDTRRKEAAGSGRGPGVRDGLTEKRCRGGWSSCCPFLLPLDVVSDGRDHVRMTASNLAFKHF